MSSTIKPWAKKAFELLFHAESHWMHGSDYDKRLALISFDNAIEVTISIYLNLDPKQRAGKSYKKEEVSGWLRNYHTKLDFFKSELDARGLPEHRDIPTIVWLHKQRNEIYHGSTSGVPEEEVIKEIRFVAIWIFSILFEQSDIESILKTKITDSEKSEHRISNQFLPDIPQENKELGLSPAQALSLAAATLVGKWDEQNVNDVEILRKLADGF